MKDNAQDFFEEEDKEGSNEFDIFSVLIINHDGTFIAIWKLMDVVLCLVSSWTYMWMTVFSIEGVDTTKMEEYGRYIEIFFVLTVIFGFLTDFKRPGEHIAEKKLSVISKRYLNEDFLTDFIPLFPLPELLISLKLEHKFSYIIKVIRIHKG